ncbi:MAG: aminotransferase class I/II-fold pyridoxal phosphate-dependent enzyme, partial [Planctomycetota bacterium]|nr:aminotransferase class I/II-fold pyridoxal phosphate-dependent enzyme [Planctomycetota bacterium]
MTQTLPSLNLASRMSRLGTETAFEVLARAKQLESEGRDIVHLEIGEPDFDTPANIVEAGRQALAEGWTHYGPAAGLPDAREAVAHYVATTRGTSVNGNEVCIVPGGKPVMFYALLALAEAGDEV